MMSISPGQGSVASHSLEELASHVESVSPSQLLSLLSISDADIQPQTPEALAAALEDMLTAPIEVNLRSSEDTLAQEDHVPPPSTMSAFKSLGELLHHSSPDPELLDLVKRAAKQHIGQESSEVPQDVATVIYYAAIASAWTRCSKRITMLSDNELRQGLRWVLRRDWTDGETKELIGQALDTIEQGDLGQSSTTPRGRGIRKAPGGGR